MMPLLAKQHAGNQLLTSRPYMGLWDLWLREGASGNPDEQTSSRVQKFRRGQTLRTAWVRPQREERAAQVRPPPFRPGPTSALLTHEALEGPRTCPALPLQFLLSRSSHVLSRLAGNRPARFPVTGLSCNCLPSQRRDLSPRDRENLG